MKNIVVYIPLIICSLALLTSCEKDEDFSTGFPSTEILGKGHYEGAYWPTVQWRTCAPENVGMDPELLRKMNEDMVLQMRLHIDVHSVHVIRNSYIVAEQYYSPDFGQDSLHPVYSCTKSLTSAAFGIALDKGFIPSLETPLLDYFPDYEITNPAGKEQITLRNALTMTAGFEWDELSYPYDDERNSVNQWFYQDNDIGFILNQPMADIPGNSFNYHSGISHLLSVIIQKQTGMRLDSFVAQEIFNPTGISDYTWTINPDGTARGYTGLYLKPRDLAKIGLLYLNNGRWEGRQLIPESWVRESTEKHIIRGDIPGFYYGYQWWVHESGYYAAVGLGRQLVIVDRENELVVVFTNNYNDTDWFQLSTPWRLLETFILPSIIQ